MNEIKLNAFLISIMKFQWNNLFQKNFFLTIHCLLLVIYAYQHLNPDSWAYWAFLILGKDFSLISCAFI